MDKKRELELLAYAKVCFEHCTNPFDHIHLTKMKVNADECRDLSHLIADILESEIQLDPDRTETTQFLIDRAEKEFMETQE